MIISILGTSGAFKNRENCTPQRDEEGKIKSQSAFYHSEVLDKKSGSYKNSTEFLLDNYDEKFVFIGTQCAIAFQKIILEKSLEQKEIEYVSIQDDSLDDIFEKILELLQKEKSKVILDITHGFRHQPIMAIFASTLSQFLETKALKILFAKEVVTFQEYRYIYLDEYIEITQISLLLTGFIRTLNFIPVESMKLLEHKIFEDFSKSLLSNDIKGVEKNYYLLQKELERLKQNKELKHISSLIKKVEDELKPLESFSYLSYHQKYMLLGKMTIDKNYLIISLAYLFESYREYCSDKFGDICKDIHFKNTYARNDMVMKSITNYSRGNKILKKYPHLYYENKSEFTRVNALYTKLRRYRNDLAHINTTEDFPNIKSDVEALITEVEALFNAQILARIVF